jgi:hypothetical protein
MKEAIIISGILAFFIKIAIHVWLNVKNKRFEGLKPFNMMPFLYFFPYMEGVKAGYQKQKAICNMFYVLFIFLVAVSLIFY